MRDIRLGRKYVGSDTPCYIIAEMSANHAGEIERALEIVRAAKAAGADCIKIQTYTADTITLDCDNEYFKIKEGKWRGENLHELYQKAYTPWEWQARIKEEAEKMGLDFLSTPFDRTAVDFLEGLGVSFYKIASFEVVDIPLIKYVASKGKPIVMSTGMATLGEIEEAVQTIRANGDPEFCLLRCSSAYPAIPEDMNLKSLKTLSEIFQAPVGLSDHSMGMVAAVTAVALGAKVIEKHFCISRKIENPDASFSMEPEEFRQMVDAIRETEKAMGQVSFDVSEGEKASRALRKSIFISESVRKGDILSERNIRVVRPANGLEPKHFEDVLGKRFLEDFEAGTPLRWNMFD